MQADLVATVSQLDDAYLHNLTFNDEKLKFVKTKRKQSMALSSAASELAVMFLLKFLLSRYFLKFHSYINLNPGIRIKIQ